MDNGRQFGTTSAQSPSGVLILPASPLYPNTAPSQPRIPHYRVHLILSGLQLSFGTFCFSLGILGRSIDWYNIDSGCGYCGVPFFMAGLFGFLATRPNSVINKKCNFFACCLTFSVVSSISSVIGISLSKGERMRIPVHREVVDERLITFHLVKLWLVLVVCAVEFLVSIVHAGFVCASCCDQCVNRIPNPPSAPAPLLLPETSRTAANAGTSSAPADPPLLSHQPATVALPKTFQPHPNGDQRPTAPPTYEETFPYEGPPLEDFDEFPRGMSP